MPEVSLFLGLPRSLILGNSEARKEPGLLETPACIGWPVLPARGGPLLEELAYTLQWSYRLHVRLKVGINFGTQQFEQIFGGIDVNDEEASALAAQQATVLDLSRPSAIWERAELWVHKKSARAGPSALLASAKLIGAILRLPLSPEQPPKEPLAPLALKLSLEARQVSQR